MKSLKDFKDFQANQFEALNQVRGGEVVATIYVGGSAGCGRGNADTWDTDTNKVGCGEALEAPASTNN